jgi:hypothetical protein
MVSEASSRTGSRISLTMFAERLAPQRPTQGDGLTPEERQEVPMALQRASPLQVEHHLRGTLPYRSQLGTFELHFRPPL